MAHLLIIDDDDLLREALATVLISAGHTVTQAADGRKALALFRAEPADLIVSDLVMPDREGLEIISQLHREDPALPIIAMSGGATRSQLYLAMAAKLGASRTLSKPFTPATLLRVIDELLPPPSQPRSTTVHENPPP
jgi:DNA-binding NtrC family response regulator